MNLDFFPPLNATLNGIAGLLLVAGFFLVKSGNRKGHAVCMVSALVVSAIFLVSYVTFKTLKRNVHTSFPEGYPMAEAIYYPMLISHVILAIGMLPLIFLAVRHAARGNFDKHRKIVRWAYPIWLYVSVTGVLVYFFLYQWFLPTEMLAEPSEATPAAEILVEGAPSNEEEEEERLPIADAPAIEAEPVSGGALAFEPEVFEADAEMGQTELTATFQVKNVGTAPVVLTRMESSCTCLSVEAGSREIAPGAEVTLTAVFDIGRLSGDAEKSLFISTNIPDSREKRLPVRVSIPAVIDLDPVTVKWDIGEKPEAREIRFRVLRDEPIRITEVKSSRASVAVSLETVEEGRDYRIWVDPESTEDTMLGFVRLVTDCELDQFKRMMAYFAVRRPD